MTLSHDHQSAEESALMERLALSTHVLTQDRLDTCAEQDLLDGTPCEVLPESIAQAMAAPQRARLQREVRERHQRLASRTRSEAATFREDIDAYVDQDPTPRG